MKLLLDQGNTRLKWYLANSDGHLIGRGSGFNAEGAERILKPACRLARSQCREVVASVVAREELARELEGVVESLFHIRFRRVWATENFHWLRNGYRDPRSLGSDRWVGMIGAVDMTACSPFILVCAGTAITIDAVNADGRHLGGMIVPGLSAQRRMIGETTGLKWDVVSQFENVWGRSTAEAIENGIALGIVSLIENRAVELDMTVNDTCRVVITGGDAAMLAPLIKRPVVVQEDLMCRGLWLWAMDADGTGAPCDKPGRL